MGMFSWSCSCCRRSIRSQYAIRRPDQTWLTRVVAISRTTKLAGVYDGYGRVLAPDVQPPPLDDESLPDILKLSEEKGSVSVFHEDCWRLVGRPGYSGPSRFAQDQGYFLNQNAAHPSPLIDKALGATLLARWSKKHPPVPSSEASDGR